MQYEVTVYTRVKEIYVVEADSADEAERDWASGRLDSSECVEIMDVDGAVEIDD